MKAANMNSSQPLTLSTPKQLRVNNFNDTDRGSTKTDTSTNPITMESKQSSHCYFPPVETIPNNGLLRTTIHRKISTIEGKSLSTLLPRKALSELPRLIEARGFLRDFLRCTY